MSFVHLSIKRYQGNLDGQVVSKPYGGNLLISFPCGAPRDAATGQQTGHYYYAELFRGHVPIQDPMIVSVPDWKIESPWRTWHHLGHMPRVIQARRNRHQHNQFASSGGMLATTVGGHNNELDTAPSSGSGRSNAEYILITAGFLHISPIDHPDTAETFLISPSVSAVGPIQYANRDPWHPA